MRVVSTAVAVTLLGLGACTTLSQEDRALIASANQNAQEAKAEAARSAEMARQAQAAAQRASEDAKAANEKADRMFQRTLRK
jgi:hypothetical protein